MKYSNTRGKKVCLSTPTVALSLDVVLISVVDLISISLGDSPFGHVSVHCLSASVYAVGVICHSRHQNSHVSIRKEHKGCNR